MQNGDFLTQTLKQKRVFDKMKIDLSFSPDYVECRPMCDKMKLKLLFLQTVLHLIVWYAGPGQNNNANFDTDVEAGGASEDENQVRKMVRRMLMMVMVLPGCL